jgi:hypothetical protein
MEVILEIVGCVKDLARLRMVTIVWLELLLNVGVVDGMM